MTWQPKPGSHFCMCKVCGSLFTAMRAHARHCSISCGNHAAYLRRRSDPARYAAMIERNRAWRRGQHAP